MNQKIETHGEVHRPSNPNANTVWLGVVKAHAKFHTYESVLSYACDMEKCGQDKTEPDSRNSKLHYRNDAQGPMPQEVSDL